MKRLIVDYKKLDENMLTLLAEKFPDGYDQSDIIHFRNSKNEVIEAVEIRTDDTVYLIKVGLRLVKAMEDFEEDKDNANDDESSPEVVPENIEDEDGDD